MFKQMMTLFRGRAYEAAEAVTDTHALAILRQQIRDCAASLEAARRAVAVALAQNRQEEAQCKAIEARLADLETRTIEALKQDRQDLALEAAEAIAMLEAERDASNLAQARFASEIARLRQSLRAAEQRLSALERGQRIAVATEHTQRLRETAPASSLNALKDAEATLKRLQARQQRIDATNEALAEMDQSRDPASIAEKLAAAGCGAPLKTSAADVLARLKAKLETSHS
jgi:phage shock protein A